MGSNIATILSFIFVALFFVLGIDMLAIQFAFTDLDRIAVTFSYVIAKNATVSDELITSYCDEYNVTFTCLSNCTPRIGDVVEYKLSKQFNPILMSSEAIDISVIRTTVIGYYN